MKANKKKEPKNWFRVTGILPPDDTAIVKRNTRESMTDKTNGYHIMSNAIMMYLKPHEFKLFSYIVKQSARNWKACRMAQLTHLTKALTKALTA